MYIFSDVESFAIYYKSSIGVCCLILAYERSAYLKDVIINILFYVIQSLMLMILGNLIMSNSQYIY